MTPARCARPPACPLPFSYCGQPMHTLLSMSFFFFLACHGSFVDVLMRAVARVARSRCIVHCFLAFFHPPPLVIWHLLRLGRLSCSLVHVWLYGFMLSCPMMPTRSITQTQPVRAKRARRRVGAVVPYRRRPPRKLFSLSSGVADTPVASPAWSNKLILLLQPTAAAVCYRERGCAPPPPHCSDGCVGRGRRAASRVESSTRSCSRGPPPAAACRAKAWRATGCRPGGPAPPPVHLPECSRPGSAAGGDGPRRRYWHGTAAVAQMGGGGGASSSIGNGPTW